MSQITLNNASAARLESQYIQSSEASSVQKRDIQNTEVLKKSPEINFAALGINPRKMDKASLRQLLQSPQAIRALAKYQMKRLFLSHKKEKKIKGAKWKGLASLGKISKEQLEKNLKVLEKQHSDERRNLQSELQLLLEDVEEKTLDIDFDTIMTDTEMGEWDKADEIAVQKFVKELPDLDNKKEKSTFCSRLFSMSGLSLLATTSVGILGTTIGIAALPAAGILGALGITATVAAPALYSSISSFVAICAPQSKNVLENIDDIRKSTPTELAGMKRELEKNRHDTVIAAIDESKKSDRSTNSDLLAEWEQSHTKIQKNIELSLAPIPHKDLELLGLTPNNVSEKMLNRLSFSPTVVRNLANQEIARQEKRHKTELSLVAKKLKNLVAAGEKTQEESDTYLVQCKKRQTQEKENLCKKLAQFTDQVRFNREVLQGTLATMDNQAGNTEDFEKILNEGKDFDAELAKHFCAETPTLPEEKEQTTFLGRLFSWSGAKMMAKASLSALGIAGAVALSPAIGLAAALGLTLPAIGSTAYSTISSFVAICNPNAKEFLLPIDDIVNGIKGEPAELAKMTRDRDKNWHEEILEHLQESKTNQKTNDVFFEKTKTNENTSKVDNQKDLEQITQMIVNCEKENKVEEAKQLKVIQQALRTIVNAEKCMQIQKGTSQVDSGKDQQNIGNIFKALGVDPKKTDQKSLEQLLLSPKTVRSLANYQMKRLSFSHEKEKKLKEEQWASFVSFGSLTKEKMEENLKTLEKQQSTEKKELLAQLQKSIELSEKNRRIREGEDIKESGLNTEKNDEILEKWDKMDEDSVEKFVKDLPDLEKGKEKSTFSSRLFSASGLSLLATTSVAALGTATGLAGLPAIGMVSALGVSASLAAPSLYSSISSFIAIYDPSAKDTLTHINDVRKKEPTELAGMKRELDKSRHANIIASIDSRKNSKTDATHPEENDDLLAVWESTHEDKLAKKTEAYDKTNPLIDLEILGLNAKNVSQATHKNLSSSPSTVRNLANHEIARQQKRHQKELSVLERKLDGLVALGEKTQEDADRYLEQAKEQQAEEKNTLCANLSRVVNQVRFNREVIEGSVAETADQSDFEQFIEQGNALDAELAEHFCAETPTLPEEKKETTFLGRLFSWSGAKMMATASLAAAGIALASTTVFPALGLAATLGLTIPSVGSAVYSTVSSFAAICNPNAKEILLPIQDIVEGVKGRPAELSKMKRDTDKERYEEILDHLKTTDESYDFSKTNKNNTASDNIHENNQKYLEHVSNMLSTAEKQNNQDQVQQLSILKESMLTVLNAEKEANQKNKDSEFILHQISSNMKM